MLSVFSSCGRRLLPAIQLATPVSALHCSAHFVMVLTAGATLSVWSVLESSALLLSIDLLDVFMLLQYYLIVLLWVISQVFKVELQQNSF